MTGGFKKLKRYLERIYFDKPISYQSNIFGTILVLIGIVFLYNPTPINIKIGITSILIGTLMIFIITGKITTKGISDVQITLIMTTWVLVMFFITGDARLEMFFILIVLGVLMVKELTDEFTTVHLRNRMSVLIFGFLIIFFTIMIQKIINFLNI